MVHKSTFEGEEVIKKEMHVRGLQDGDQRD